MSAMKKTFDKFDESKRIVAKLMARENITVVVDPSATTAFFTLETRTLHVPNWQLSVDQCDMLLAHEVGHALFTDPVRYKAAHRTPDGTSLPGIDTYVNVLEDARIERLIQEMYPGLVGVFRRAYETFHADGPLFKGTRRTVIDDKTGTVRPIKHLRLIDRINVAYKLGSLVDVPFRADEHDILRRLDAAATVDDIAVLAHELYAADRADGVGQPNPAPPPTFTPVDEDQPFDPGEVADRGMPLSGVGNTDVLSSFVDTSGPPMVVCRPLSDDVLRHFLIDHETYMQEHMPVPLQEAGPALQAWQQDHKPVIQHMVNEFLRRRTGKVDVLSQMTSTGRLDPKQLAHYRFTDRLFQQVRVTPSGLNHGLVMLIDGSESMSRVMPSVIEQVMQFAHFAQKAAIPLQVLMFASVPSHLRPSTDRDLGATWATFPPYELRPADGRQPFVLVTIVDTTSSIPFRQQMLALTCLRMRWVPEADRARDPFTATAPASLLNTLTEIGMYLLGATPLVGSTLIVERVVGRLKTQRRLDRMTLCVLSDGGDTDGGDYTTATGDVRTIITQNHHDKRPVSPCVVRDAVTKRLYSIVRADDPTAGVHNGLLAAQYDMIARRHHARVIHLYLTPTTSPTDMLPVLTGDASTWPRNVGFPENGQYVCPAGVGVAPLTVAVIPASLSPAPTVDVPFPGKSLSATLRDFKRQATLTASRRKLVNVLMPSLA